MPLTINRMVQSLDDIYKDHNVTVCYLEGVMLGMEVFMKNRKEF